MKDEEQPRHGEGRREGRRRLLGAGGAPLLVVVVALAVRAIYFVQIADSPLFDTPLGDGRQYLAWAEEIRVEGWLGDEVFYQAPLYPYFLAMVGELFGSSLPAAQLLQALLGALACGLLAAAGRSFFGARVGLVAGLVLALYPPAVFFDGVVQKASLALFATTLLLWALSRRQVGGDRRWLILAGAATGALVLLRENALLFVPVLLLWAYLALPGGTGRRRLVGPVWLLAGLLLLLGPVALRNALVAGDLVLTTSQAGANFFIGNGPGADGRYRPLLAGRQDARVERQDAQRLAESAVGRELSAAEVSSYWFDATWRSIAERPAAWLGLLARKGYLAVHRNELVDTESIEAYADVSVWLRISSALLGFGVVLPVALFGVWWTRRRWRDLWVLYGLALAVVAGLVLFYVMARYRMPLVPVAILFAAAGGVALFDLGRRGELSPPSREVAVGLALALVAAALAHGPLPIETAPRATTYFNLGVALFESGRLPEAQAALERAAELQPRVADVSYELGRVLAARGAASAAVERLRRALELDPEHQAARRELARQLVADGATEEGLALLEQWQQLQPEDPVARVELALQLLALSRLGEAEEHLRRALELDPAHGLAHNLLGNLLAQRGEREAARAEYEAAVRLDDGLADAHFKLARLLFEDGEVESARRHFTRTVDLLPELGSAWLGLGVTSERLGREVEAAAAYRRALELRPPAAEMAEARLRLAWLLATAADDALLEPAEAVSLAEQAQGVLRDARSLDVLAAALAANGELEAAVGVAARGVAAAQSRGQAAQIESRRRLYLEGRPYRRPRASSD